MLRFLPIASAAIVCISVASAQSAIQAVPLPGAVQHAGIYHVATGTWTRQAASAAATGSDIIYDNTVDSGYFATLGSNIAQGDFSLIDAGRLPGPTSAVADGFIETYVVDTLTFGYCTDQVGPTIGATFNLYESYDPCDLILTSPGSPFTLSGTFVGTGLPGAAAGAVACWTVTLDLAGSGQEFCMEGEGGDQFPGHDGDLMTDSFGVELIFNGVAGSNTGPLLAGDPTWTPAVAGALTVGGTGTYYDNTGAATCGNTGLDTQDFMAIDGPLAPFPPRCFFFGGYLNTNGCGNAQNNPHASIYLSFGSAVFCDKDPSDGPFCEPAGVNSSGNAAVLSATATAAGAGVRLNASGGPQLPNSGFGLVVVSSGTMAAVSIGDGTLCLASPQGRYHPDAGGALVSLGQFDANGNFENLAGTSTTGFGFDIPTALPTPPGGSISGGSTWHFQLWYRDLNPGGTVNFTNGVSVTF